MPLVVDAPVRLVGLAALTASFLVPNAGQTVAAAVNGTAMFFEGEYVTFVDAAGDKATFQVTTIVDGTNVVLTYAGGPGSRAPSTQIDAGAVILPESRAFPAVMLSIFGAGDALDFVPGGAGPTTLAPTTEFRNFGPWPNASTATFVNDTNWGGTVVLVRGTLDLANAPAGAFSVVPAANAGNAAGATGGAAGVAATNVQLVYGTDGPVAGANGAVGAGSTAANVTRTALYAGGISGGSGANGGAGTNAGGTKSSYTGTPWVQTNGFLRNAICSGSNRPGITGQGALVGGTKGLLGAPGGGSGVVAGGGAGGAGVGGQGIHIGANQINRGATTAALAIVVNGGAGGNGGNGAGAAAGGGGPSGGGAGGYVSIVACLLSGVAVANLVQVDGGAGGTGGNAGAAAAGADGAQGGMSGGVTVLLLGLQDWSQSPGTDTITAIAGTAGSAHSGTTGGAGGAGGQGRVTV